MLTTSQSEVLRDKVYDLLANVGMRIESDEMTEKMLAKGCTALPSGRIRIPKTVIDELVAFQKKKQAQEAEDQWFLRKCGPDWAHHIILQGRQKEMRDHLTNNFQMAAFDCGPTLYYNYQKQEIEPVNTDILIEMMKFAHATPEIGYISTWYRQDVPQETERVESLVQALKCTDKVDGIEAIFPEVIKYLVEASEIITGKAGDSSYLAGSECITSPLIFEERSAEDSLERARLGVSRYHIASMPTVGVSTPVTIASSVILGAAELLGGMVACWCIDPESDISGRMICSVADMRTAKAITTSPEKTMFNLAVKELFDAFWGGHCWVEPYFSPSTGKPGLQAVVENVMGGDRYYSLRGDSDVLYPGMGTLQDGALGSPEQFMLDMEIRKAQFFANKPIEVTDDTMLYDLLADFVENEKEFLTSEHTLTHFRDLWSSNIIMAGADCASNDEKALLDNAAEAWRANLEKYEPPVWPEEKVKALEDLAARSRKEFLG